MESFRKGWFLTSEISETPIRNEHKSCAAAFAPLILVTGMPFFLLFPDFHILDHSSVKLKFIFISPKSVFISSGIDLNRSYRCIDPPEVIGVVGVHIRSNSNWKQAFGRAVGFD